MPAITVILPLYNRRATIGRAVESVLRQTLADFEFLIVDDASTDDSVAIVESYGDPRIRVLRQATNQHAAAARNRAIEECRTELISFLDSDDEFFPDKLAFVVDYFGRHPEADALLDSYEQVYPPDKHKQPVMRINPKLEGGDQVLPGIFARKISKATPALSVRRQALVAVGLFDPKLGRRQDFDLVRRLAVGGRVHTTDRVLWRKYWAEASITGRNDTFMDAILEMCRREPTYLTDPRYRIGAARDFAHHVWKLIRKGRWQLLRRDLGRFRAEHGSLATLRLAAEGLIESLRRAARGER